MKTKKTIFIAAWLLLNLWGVVRSQGKDQRPVFEDAVALKQVIEANNNAFKIDAALAPLLTYYYGNLNTQKLNDSLLANPFLKPYYAPLGAAGVLATPGLNLAKGISGVGSLDVTNLALGLTDFLIARTKTELNTAFFKRFKQELKEEEELGMLFPQTTDLLSFIDHQIYQYDLYLNSLRNAFENDLKGLLNNVPQVLEYHRETLNNINHWGYPAAALSIEMIQLVKEREHPGAMIRQLGESLPLVSLASNNINHKGIKYSANGLVMISLLSESFRRSTPDSDHYWVDKDQLTQLKDPIVVQLYFGLLYELVKKKPYNEVVFPVKDGEIKLSVMLQDLGKNWTSRRQEAQQFMKGFSEHIKAISSAVEKYTTFRDEKMEKMDLTTKARNKLLFDHYYEVFASTVDLMQQFHDLENLSARLDFPENTKDLLNYLEFGGELSVQVMNKQYAGAITNAGLLLNESLDTLLKKNERLEVVVAKVFKYGSFMAALVEAESPEEAQSAIEAVALPPGSYTVKRVSRFNVAINGYLGGFFGQEEMDEVEENEALNNIALTAPVGISLSFGNFPCRSCANPWSIGLSIPVLDLGNIASYRIDDPDNVESVPTIQLQDIVSPGIFLEVGLGSTPLTLGGGVQLGPRLRQIEPGADANEVGDMYVRYGLALKADIPILNLYSSPGKVKRK